MANCPCGENCPNGCIGCPNPICPEMAILMIPDNHEGLGSEDKNIKRFWKYLIGSTDIEINWT